MTGSCSRRIAKSSSTLCITASRNPTISDADAPPRFTSASVCVFAAWAMAGAWRLMRLELQLRNSPWVWVAFLFFAAVWRA